MFLGGYPTGHPGRGVPTTQGVYSWPIGSMYVSFCYLYIYCKRSTKCIGKCAMVTFVLGYICVVARRTLIQIFTGIILPMDPSTS